MRCSPSAADGEPAYGAAAACRRAADAAIFYVNTKNRLCTIVCRGGLFIRGSDLFIKIEEGLILAGAVHTGGEHPVGGIVFLIAFGDDVGEVEAVERPVRGGGERLLFAPVYAFV